MGVGLGRVWTVEGPAEVSDVHGLYILCLGLHVVAIKEM